MELLYLCAVKQMPSEGGQRLVKIRVFCELMKNTNSHYLYGRRAVIEALNAGREIEKIFVQYGASGDVIEEIRMKARQKNIACSIADKMKFNDLERRIPLERGSAQGVIALTTMIEYVELFDLLDGSMAKTANPLIIALDEITDPHNVGAIARSAECAGASGMILTIEHSSPITPATFKSAAGAMEFLPICKVDSLLVAIRNCKAAGFSVVGTDGLAEARYTDAGLFDGPTILIIGSEGKGIRPAIRKECTTLIRIPMYGNVESLNASAAAAIIMFERAKQSE
jgi:23S rRNA (guanosine2251-2'-O)-methyltransferase